MNFKSKVPLLFLFLSVLLLTSTLAVSYSTNQKEARLDLKQCMKECLNQQDSGEQRECIQECHQGYKEKVKPHNNNMELIEAMINPSIDNDDVDPKEELEKCQLDCVVEAKGGVSKELECIKKCDEKYQELEKMQFVDKDDKQEFKQCLTDCAMGAKHTVDEVYACDLECVKKHHEKRGVIINVEEEKLNNMEKPRLGGHNMELFDAIMVKTKDEDPKELEKCQLDCVVEAKGGVSKELECIHKCDEDYKKKHMNNKEDTNRHHEKCQNHCVSGAMHTYTEIYDCDCEKKCFQDYPPHDRERHTQASVYDNKHSEDKEELKKCLIDCGMGAKHTVAEVYACDLKCMKDHPQKIPHRIKQPKEEPECQRQCWRKSPAGSVVEYECMTVCRRENKQPDQRHLSECQKMCLRNGQGVECQERCQKEFQKHPILKSIVELTAGLF